MANTISNNRISNVVQSQLPFFVRGDHQTFAKFLEYYYEYLEQDQKTVNTIKNLKDYQNVDLTIDQFSDRMYTLFMKYIPKDTAADKDVLIKHIKDFYRAKGTEKATRFLMRLLYNKEIEFYYPKKDILRASDGKWFVQKSLRITETQIENVANNTLFGLEKFTGTRITGNTSNASALVERVDRFFEQGTQIDELIISNVDGNFENGETVFAIFNDTEDTDTITANIFGGIVSSVLITNAGTGYSIGDPVVFLSNTGTGACATVTSVSTGNISSIAVISGGAGYRVRDQVLFTGGGGSGANANVSAVSLAETIHPNSYNIVYSTISLEANTLLNNTIFSNLSSSNVNTSLMNAVNTFVYANTGPISSLLVLSPGSNYTTDPTLSVVANSMIFGLGVLGRMEIIDGGQNYAIGDVIEFINVPGGYGFGATGNVTNVDNQNSNAISQVKFQRLYGHLIGGAGYDMNYLPTANVISGTGTGANIRVTSILGSGANLDPITSSIGGIERITIYNRGSNYLSNTTIDLTGSGDGTGRANAVVVQGVYSYPGRFLNDDGQLSSYNFLEDRDYYQTFSYVIRSTKSIAQYRQIVKNVIHPAGLKLFGEHLYVSEESYNTVNVGANSSSPYITRLMPYTKTGNTYNVVLASHGISANANVYMIFDSGSSNVYRHGIKMVQNSQPNFFTTIQKSNVFTISIVNGGLNYNSNGNLVIVGDGNGANAYYNVNSAGAIVTVTFRDHGINYTSVPTITANGSNSVPATFTSTLSHNSNTSGNVYVSVVQQ